MPYMIVQNGDNYDVFKRGEGNKPTGSRLGRHESREDAANQIAAIEANEDKTMENKEKYQQLLTQAEAGYVTISPNLPRACINCRWFAADSEFDKCRIVINNDPYPIAEGGYCNEHRNYPLRDDDFNPTGLEMNPAVPPPLNPEEALSEILGMEMEEMAKKPKPVLNGDEDAEESPSNPEKKGILESINEAIGSLSNTLPSLQKWLNPDKNQPESEMGGFKLLDDNRFIAWWTNNFEDREKEIISEYAIDEFITKANSGLVPMPELWWQHIPGTRHGITEKLYRIGHFAVALGYFDSEESNPLVKDFKSWYAKQKNITMSHGFFYKAEQKINGVYYHIRTYEISSLIAGREANSFTNFEVIKMLTEPQRADLERELGKDLANRVIANAETAGKALEGQSIAFKSLPSGFGAETMLLLGAVKAVQEDASKAVHEADEARKEAKDNGNQLEALKQAVGGYADATQRLSEKVDSLIKLLSDFTKLQPPASKSPFTQVPSTDAEANFIVAKNEEGGKQFVSVLEQMRSKGINELPKTE